jgi:hypothetical protein
VAATPASVPAGAGAPEAPDARGLVAGPASAPPSPTATLATAQPSAAGVDTGDAAAHASPEPAATEATAAEPPVPRPRADPARARAVAAASRTAQPVAERGPGRTVEQLCTNSNAALRGICEARQCSRRAHSGEALCQRLRAADDRRRQQD